MRKRIADLQALGSVIEKAGGLCLDIADGFSLELSILAEEKPIGKKARKKKSK
jgi:hypothetical protein